MKKKGGGSQHTNVICSVNSLRVLLTRRDVLCCVARVMIPVEARLNSAMQKFPSVGMESTQSAPKYGRWRIE